MEGQWLEGGLGHAGGGSRHQCGRACAPGPVQAGWRRVGDMCVWGVIAAALQLASWYPALALPMRRPTLRAPSMQLADEIIGASPPSCYPLPAQTLPTHTLCTPCRQHHRRQQHEQLRPHISVVCQLLHLHRCGPRHGLLR